MENSCKSIGVLGGGSWGTAIVKILLENNDTVHWWVREEYTKMYIEKNHHNPNYISSVEFDTKRISLYTNINDFVKSCDTLVFAVPSIYLEKALLGLTESLSNKKIFSAIKGIVPGYSDIVGNFLHEKYNVPEINQGVIVGPCHAEEVAMERLSYLTICAFDEDLAKKMAECMRSDFIKTTTSNDVYGAEYAAVLKNIFALAAGVAHGLGYGDNFLAVLLSNSIREMERFLDKINPLERNINNSAYLGDLLVTGYSFFSRNRMLGNMIGKGYTVKSAILEMQMVAEGYYATEGIFQLSEKNEIDMPITKAVYKILYEGKNPKKVFKKLTDNLD